MTDKITIDAANIVHHSESPVRDAEKEAERAGRTVLKRLILWIEKEAYLAGADIETEITSILTKLHLKGGS